MRMIVPLLFVASILAACHGSEQGSSYEIYPLRMKTGSGGGHNLQAGITCSSWRLAVETHNIIDWTTVPEECADYIGNYILGQQYRDDSKAVNREAFFYARSLNFTKKAKNIWIFDVDETTLSNLPYYAEHGFGVEPYNATAFNEWVDRGEAPALPETLKLYKKVLGLGFKIVFLTGRSESQRNITAQNLKQAGYKTWTKLITKSSEYSGQTAVQYKSTERTKLVDSGYTILGNIGDQWSDLLGNNPGNRTFKLPDPMYYIS